MEVPQFALERLKPLLKSAQLMMIRHTANKDRALCEVIAGLYIGSVASVIFSKNLKEAGITHVVSAIKNIKLTYVYLYYQ